METRNRSNALQLRSNQAANLRKAKNVANRKKSDDENNVSKKKIKVLGEVTNVQCPPVSIIEKSKPRVSASGTRKLATKLSAARISKRTVAAPEAEQVVSIPTKDYDLNLDIVNPETVGIEDFDKLSQNEVFSCPDFAPYIFTYYRNRESQFPVHDYMKNQEDLKPFMRAVLVDWLVEVQENFELNHETLYQTVKLTDLFLSKENISRSKIQLIGATALFISCKFDERVPPAIDDFRFICDDAYSRSDFLKTERFILNVVGFDIGFPLSYRFLRRYARCFKDDMSTLTLARYILETSLMDYQLVQHDGSLVAASSLFLAHCMKEMSVDQIWNKTLEYYSTYSVSDLKPCVELLANMMNSPDRNSPNLQTIKNKYSHEVFLRVACIPSVDHIHLADIFDELLKN